jgi:hypothetical protein
MFATIGMLGVLLAAGGALAEGEYTEGTAGGGGYYCAGEYKDSFGFQLDGEHLYESELVFQGRDEGVRVEAYDFEKVWFSETEEGYPVAHAKGWAYVEGTEGYWFHLMVQDRGDGIYDRVHLWVFEDKPEEGAEAEPLYHWMAHGLGGGNVWVDAHY